MKKKELNYYDEFLKNTEIAYNISCILKDYTAEYDYNKSKEVEINVHKLENEADRNLHLLLNYLIKDFLPPIEREDIVLLANKIDDLVDNLDEIVIDLDILNITNLRNDFNEFMDLICKINLHLKNMMEQFKNSKKYEDTKKIVITINNIEEQGDRLYENAIRNLYLNEKNIIEIIKWHRIYDALEEVFDSCETIANCVDEIIMKNV